MLNRFNQGLLAILALQLVLVAVVQGNTLWTSDRPEPLLAFSTDQLTELIIEDHSGDSQQSLALVREDSRWWLEREGDRYPVSASTLETVLTPLANARLNWPVTESQSGAERFETANDNYQRRLALTTDSGDEQHLYFGTSPAFRQVHVRRGDQTEVYTINLNPVDLTAKAEAWLDTGLLQVDVSSVETVTVAGKTLSRGEAGWQWMGAETAELQQTSFQDWLNRWSTLTVLGWAKPEQESSLQQAKPLLTLDLETDTKSIRFSLYEQDGAYFLKRHDMPGWYRVASGVGQSLASVEPLWSRNPDTGGASEG